MQLGRHKPTRLRTAEIIRALLPGHATISPALVGAPDPDAVGIAQYKIKKKLETAMLGGYKEHMVSGEVDIHARVGGQGPAVLLLHGFPQNLFEWARVAPLLAGRYTVVAPTCAVTANQANRQQWATLIRSGPWLATRWRS